MIGKIIGLGVLSLLLGAPVKPILYHGVDVQYSTNYVVDLLDRGHDDKVAFYLSFSDWSDMDNLTSSYSRLTQIIYIDGLSQNIYSDFYSNTQYTANQLMGLLSSQRPSNFNQNNPCFTFGYTLVARKVSGNINGYFEFAYSSYSTWSFNSTRSLPRNYFFSGEGTDYDFTAYDYVTGFTGSSYSEEIEYFGYLSTNQVSDFLYTQRYNFSCDTEDDSLFGLTFSFRLVLANTDTNYTAGYEQGYNDGFNDGYNGGLTEGTSQGYQNGYTEGYNIGYDAGYSGALVINQNASFLNLFGLIADTPIMMLKSLFNWDLFGFNVFTAILSLITGLVVIYLVKKVIH